METALDTPAASVYSPQQQDKVFAILTSSDHNGQIRGNRRNFIDLINTGTQMGFIVYVLPVERLSLQGSRQRGFVYQHANNRWVQRLMPFPNIITIASLIVKLSAEAM